MMRLAGRALVLLAVLAALWAILPPIGDAALRYYAAIQQPSLLSAEAQPATTYVASRERALEFRLSGHADLVRLRSHALLPRAGDAGIEPSAAYALRVQILDTNGRLLAERIEHVRGVVGRYLDAATGELFAINLVDDPGYAVAGINLVPIDLSAWPTSEVIRIDLAAADDGIAEVGVRLYEPEAIPEHSIERFWQRLSDPQRERLADGNVYPSALLTVAERAAALSQRWRPVGPAGIQGQDYRVRDLFAREDRPGAFIAYAVPVADMLVGPDRPLDLPILEEGRYILRANLEAETGPADTAARLRIEVRDSGAPAATLVVISGKIAAHAAFLRPGSVRLIADRPLRVALLRNTGAGDSRTPRQVESRVYRLRGGASLTYPVAANAGDADMLRLQFWRSLDRSGPDDDTVLAVGYECLDAESRNLGGGRIEIPAGPPAPNLRSDDPTVLLAAPVRQALRLPPGTAQIVLTAPSDVFVAAFNRLQPATDGEGADGWFGLPPGGWPALIAAGDSLTLQRPADDGLTDGTDNAPQQ
jgi:hypothetical protein